MIKNLFSLFSKKSNTNTSPMRNFKLLPVVLLLLASFAFNNTAKAVSTRYCVASNTWNNTATWSASSGGASGASVPIAGDIVILERGFTVTVSAAAACASIQFSGVGATGTTLTVNTGITLTMTSTFTVTSLAGANSDGTVAGLGTITGGTTVAIGAGAPTPSGTFTTTLNSSITTWTLSAQATLTSYRSGTNYNNPVFNLTAGTFTTAGTLAAGGILTVNANAGNTATINMNTGAQTGTLVVAGTTAGLTASGTGTTTWNLDGTGSTVVYGGSGAQTIISAPTYHHLTFQGAGAKTFGGSVTITGDFNQTAGTTYVNNGATGYGFTVGGNFTLSNGTIFYMQNTASGLGCSISVAGATGMTIQNTASLRMDYFGATAANVSIIQTTNLVATSTSAAGTFGIIDFGFVAAKKVNEVRISGNFTKSGTGIFYNESLYTQGGFVFNGSGTTQNLSYAGANSDGLQYTINSGAYVKLINQNFSFTGNNYSGATITCAAAFTVNGTLDCSTFNLTAGGAFQQFILSSGATLVTANTNGVYNNTATGSSIGNALTTTFAAGAYYKFNSSLANQTTNFKFTPTTAAGIEIANTFASGTVTLNNGGATVTDVLTLTQGRLVSTAAIPIIVTNTDPAAVTGGAASPSAFVDGPLKWSIGTGTYIFPVGKGNGNYFPFTLATSASSSPVVTVETFAANAGGTADAAGFSSISTSEYWQATLNSGTFTGAVSLQRVSALTTESSIGQSTTKTGTYFNIGGTAASPAINTSNNISTLGFFVMGTGRKTYNFSTSSTFTGAASYCKNAVASALTATFNNCTVGNGSAVTTTATLNWYYNTTDITTGGTLVSGPTVVSTGSGATVSFNYTPLTTAAEVGTRYYYAVLTSPSSTSCGFTGTLTSGASTVDGTQLVIVYDNPTTATAGLGQSICASNTSAPLGGNTAGIGTGAWSVTGVPGGGSAGDITFSNSASGSSTATAALNAVTGAYTLTWTISNGACAASTANVTLTVTTKPTITLGNNTVAGASLCATGAIKVPIQSFTLAVTNCNGNLTDLGFTTAGTYTDLDVTKFQLWYGTGALGAATQVGTDITTGIGAGAHMFDPFTSPTLTAGTTYTFWITMDVDPSATDGVTISTNAISTADLTTLSNAAGGPTTAGGTQTIKGQPTALAGGSTTICQTGGSYTLIAGEAAATNGTISWAEDGTGSITVGGTSVTPTYSPIAGDAGNTVTLTMTVANAPCTSATATYTIIVDRSPSASTSGSGTQTICPNTNYTLGGAEATAGNGVITWASNGAGFITNGDTETPTYHSATADAGTTVTLTMTVTSDNDCSPAFTTATYALDVSTIVTPSITPGGATSFCRGGSVVLTASGGTPGSYTWSTGEVTDAITVSTSQAITVSIPVDGNGCFPPPSAVTNVRQWAPPTGVITGSNVYCQGGTSLLSATSSGAGSGTIASYQWQISTDGGATWSDIGGATASTYTASGPSADYRVKVTNSNGCEVVWCP